MFTVLVVEDDFGTRKLTSIVLKNAGFRTISAENGSDALTLFDLEKPDLVLCDVMLPDVNGFRITEILRKKSPEIPIIIVTAKHLKADKHYGFLVGADDYMTKPVDEEELILRIKALLRRARVASEQKLCFNELELDYSKMQATVHGKEVELTQKEFLLLFKLLSSLGKIFTRNELMEEIWGKTDSNDHTLNVHINRLREKRNDVKSVEIKAVRGLGYKGVKTDG